MNTEYNFTEIFKLRDMIDEYNRKNHNKIAYTFKNESLKMKDRYYTSFHLWCYDNPCDKENDFYISVIQNFGSYGRTEDLLEIMGLLTEEEQKIDGVVGFLTAEDVFNRIKKHTEKGDEL